MIAAILFGLALAYLGTVVIWCAVSLLEQADAEQGPPPTLRPVPDGFDAAFREHTDDALRVVETLAPVVPLRGEGR